MRGGNSLTGVKMENKQSLVINLKWGLRFPIGVMSPQPQIFNNPVTPEIGLPWLLSSKESTVRGRSLVAQLVKNPPAMQESPV